MISEFTTLLYSNIILVCSFAVLAKARILFTDSSCKCRPNKRRRIVTIHFFKRNSFLKEKN
jgi:hypothetical protein